MLQFLKTKTKTKSKKAAAKEEGNCRCGERKGVAVYHCDYPTFHTNYNHDSDRLIIIIIFLETFVDSIWWWWFYLPIFGDLTNKAHAYHSCMTGPIRSWGFSLKLEQFVYRQSMFACFLMFELVPGRGKMQFKPGFYANRMYTVCHTVAYSSSRNIYCHVLSELHNIFSIFAE